MRRRFASRPAPRPWTETEDAKLREVTKIGLSSDYWSTAFPDRRWGEVADRRLDLGIKPPPLI